jgi:post-segregation antitoxin (ccd killing protein)
MGNFRVKYHIKRQNTQRQSNGNNRIESVAFVYVSDDVVITARGKTSDVSITTTSNINLRLRKGWNPIYAIINEVLIDEGNNSLRRHYYHNIFVGNPEHITWEVVDFGI